MYRVGEEAVTETLLGERLPAAITATSTPQPQRHW